MFCQTASSACSFSRGVLCCPQERHGMLPWERHECCLSVRKIPSFSISEGAGLPDAEKAVFYHVIIRARLQICPLHLEKQNVRYSPTPLLNPAGSLMPWNTSGANHGVLYSAGNGTLPSWQGTALPTSSRVLSAIHLRGAAWGCPDAHSACHLSNTALSRKKISALQCCFMLGAF